MKRIQPPKMQPPPFLNNLYRDMRDRRLLFPALALLVALIAVPIALKSSSSGAPALSSAAGGPAGQTAAEPAVLAEEPGVTNYRRRLEQFKTKNPFRKHFTELPKSAKLTTTPAGTSSVTSTSTSSAVTTATTAGASAGLSGGTSGGGSSDTTTPPSSGSAPPGTPSGPHDLNPRWFAYQASVAFGQPGNLTRRSHVKRLAFLPNESKPMVAFLGVTQDAAKALFLVSDDVSDVSGQGRCLPGRGDCKFLELKQGEQAKLKYAPEGERTYKLRLLDVHLTSVKKPQGKAPGKRASGAILGPDG